ncbi:hypothetical protein KOW79_016831 [Hemibagrus wyckioides]|uniref:Uncharacterized protein n=1 Tax=Hemibagrus wyckioides TaxID=337641 RepID=A0A9D3NB58_9TELE|nr:hypothetical protein KOW79_016831 [Hemibagrus wyckioides]
MVCWNRFSQSTEFHVKLAKRRIIPPREAPPKGSLEDYPSQRVLKTTLDKLLAHTLSRAHTYMNAFTYIKPKRKPASVTVRMDWPLLQTSQKTQALQT